MKIVGLFTGLLICCVVNDVFSLTNSEFYELVKPYAKDIKEYDLDDPVNDVTSEDTIALPGKHDDDVDWLHILSKLDLEQAIGTNQVDDDVVSDVSWWRRRRRRRSPVKGNCSCHVDDDVVPDVSWWRRRRRRRSPVKGSCSCRGSSCNCCVKQHFSANLVFKKASFTLSGCLDIAYLRHVKGFSVALRVNGHTLYKKTMSLKKGVSICRGIPKLKVIRADVCLVFYNIDLRRKRICAKLTGNLDLRIKKFGISLPLACPIPLPFAEDFVTSNTSLISHPSLTMHQGHREMDEIHKELALTDLPALMKELQILLEDKSIREYVYDEMRALQDG